MHRTPADTSEAVDQFMAKLKHPRKADIEALRAIVLATGKSVADGIKWNAPSFRTTEYFATTNLRAKRGIGLILHLGAKVRDIPEGGLKIASVFALVLLMTACGGSSEGADSKAPTDAIQALVDRLSADPKGEWTNSLHPKLDLPASATVEEVIDRMFQVVSLDHDRVTEFRVLELRGVAIGSQPAERYNAARVYTNVGQKIVLFRREQQDWWTRVYDVELAKSGS